MPFPNGGRLWVGAEDLDRVGSLIGEDAGGVIFRPGVKFVVEIGEGGFDGGGVGEVSGLFEDRALRGTVGRAEDC